MKKGSIYSTKEKLILETALKAMYKKNFQAANISQVAEHAMLKTEQVRELFHSDDELRMAAIRYSANIWVNIIKKDIAGEKDNKTKLRKLLRHFAAGSESYPGSLSLYIDVWKRIRDTEGGDQQLLKEELIKVYDYFVSTFEELLLEDVCKDCTRTSDIRQLAWIMVVISDGLHIQNLIKPLTLDFDKSAGVIISMVSAYLSEMRKQA